MCKLKFYPRYRNVLFREHLKNEENAKTCKCKFYSLYLSVLFKKHLKNEENTKLGSANFILFISESYLTGKSKFL